jgi:hypothetical protein
MTTLQELAAEAPATTGPDLEEVQGWFAEAFNLEAPPAEKQGTIIYLIADIQGRNVRINAIKSGDAIDWIVNGVNAVRTGPLGPPVQESRSRLMQAIRRVPVARVPAAVPPEEGGG